MPVLDRSRMTLPLLAALLLAPRPASAQAAPAPLLPEFQQVAERLTDSIRQPGAVRLAVLPLADGAMPYAMNIAVEPTGHLVAALRNLPRHSDRRIVLVEQEEIDRAFQDLQIPQPVGPGGGLLVGVLVDADYVVVGMLTGPARAESRVLSVELHEVESRRRVTTATANLFTRPPDRFATLPQAVESPGPAVEFPGAVSRSSVTERWLVAGGFGAAAAASMLALSRERALRLSRARLLDLPPGAAEEWDLEYQHARDLQRNRNFWFGAALGAGGATIAYLLLAGGADDAPRLQRTIRMPIPGRWSLRVNPLAAGMLMVGAF